MSTFAYAGPTTVKVTRISDEPIVSAGVVPGYGPIFNAGVIHHDGRFHLFARGVRDGYRRNDGPGDRFLDYISDILVFTSTDGRSYDFQQLLAAGSPNEVFAYEDPRIQRVRDGGAEHVVMTYTNLPPPGSGLPWRVGVHRLAYENNCFRLNRTSGGVVGPEGIQDKDAVIFNLRDGRVGLIHRIHPNIQLAIFDTLDQLWNPPPGYWEAHVANLEEHTIIRPAEGALGVGAGAPPLVTEDGLLFFFHERGSDGHYVTKVALLDDETGRVRMLLAEPIMCPELLWECVGDVDHVIFLQGAVLQPDGIIYLTYGAADYCVGAATVAADEVVNALRATKSGSAVVPAPVSHGGMMGGSRMSHSSLRTAPVAPGAPAQVGAERADSAEAAGK